MKKSIVILVAVMFVFSLYALESFSENNEINNIEKLLNKRIKIINDYLYEEQDFLKLKERLEQIEKSTLLNSDLDVLSRVINNPTDYELAKSVKIENVINIDSKEKSIDLDAILNWKSYGYEGEKNTLKKYQVQCIFIDEEMYLKNLKNVQ